MAALDWVSILGIKPMCHLSGPQALVAALKADTWLLSTVSQMLPFSYRANPGHGRLKIVEALAQVNGQLIGSWVAQLSCRRTCFGA